MRKNHFTALAAAVALFAVFIAATASAAPRAGIDALSDAARAKSAMKPAQAKNAAKAFARMDGVNRVHIEERLDVPSFVWLDATMDPSKAKARSLMQPEDAARSQLRELASLYRMTPGEVDAAPLLTIERVMEGWLARFGNERDGIEVFRDTAAVMMNADRQVVAIGGYLGASGTAQSLSKSGGGFTLTAAQAIAYAMTDYGFTPDIASSLAYQGSKSVQAKVAQNSAYEYYGAAGTRSATGAYLAEPARAKAVWFRLPDGLVPAYYVETLMYDPASDDTEGYGYVVAADDGRFLFRKNQQADATFTYRVYAESTGIKLPTTGPAGRGGFPHPTATNNGFQAPLLPANDVTLDFGPISTSDPWLALGATTTVGNNVNAFANLRTPDDFSPADPNECLLAAVFGSAVGDFHACTSSAGAFQYNFNHAVNANATKENIVASTVNLFYINNWLHDWYYDAGFKETDGNAQANNFGRGGLGADAIKAQAQDFSGVNNANMLTPADGAAPRMRMYIFTPPTLAQITVNAPVALAGTVMNAGVFLTIGPSSFDVTAPVVQALDAAGTLTDACTVLSNAAEVAGKIAIVRFTTACSPLVAYTNVAAAGAAGMILAVYSGTQATTNFTGFSSASPSLPLLMVGISDGPALVANLTGLNVRLRRAAGPLRDGTIDNGIIAHEWGHFISNRLVGNAAGLNTDMSAGMGEGFGDFHGLLLLVKEEDGLIAANANFNGTYSVGGYVLDGLITPPLPPSDAYYNGIRRYPYSSNTAKNPLTYKHVQNGVALPATPTPAFGADGADNFEVHSAGEVWASMLWQCYSNLLRDKPRLTFAQAQDRMKKYLVAGYKLTPASPTMIEGRDAILAAMAANDPADVTACAAGFATRGAGRDAVSPNRLTEGNDPVTESFNPGAAHATLPAAALSVPGAQFCDADSVLDNGERGKVGITVTNTGFQAITGAVLTVSSPTAGVSFPAGVTATVPSLAIGASTVVLIDIGLSGAASLSQVTINSTLTHASLPSSPAITNSFSLTVQGDVVPSGTDNVEGTATVWTFALTGSTNAALNWDRVEYGPGDHRWHGAGSDNTAHIAWLVSPALQVSAAGPFGMTFSHRFDFENAGGNFDGGVIEVSQDGGTTWADIETLVPATYNGTLLGSTGNPAQGRRAYVGQLAAMTPVTLNFPASLNGKTVKVRFGSSSDSLVAFQGWDVDNIGFTGITNAPFTALGANASSCTVTLSAGSAQSTPAGQAFALALKALVQKNAAAFAGVPVTFTAPASGASGTFPGSATTVTVNSDAGGIATAPAFTANSLGGSYNVVATAGSLSVNFALTNTGGIDPAGDADNDGIPNGVESIEGRNVNVKDNDVFANARLFTMQQYRDFLGREGDAGGITFYVNLLNAGTLVRGNVIENFFNSPEFSGVASPIARLYFATFLRTPDYAGLLFQINIFRSGASLAAIANNFTLSGEFQTRYGTLTNAQYVTLLYQNILGRTPVQAEIDFHVNRLATGTTRGEVLVGFSESPEYKANIANEVYVTMMYVGMLRRAPDPGGLTFWVNYMDTGNPGLALILGFLNAPEYHNRFLP